VTVVGENAVAESVVRVQHFAGHLARVHWEDGLGLVQLWKRTIAENEEEEVAGFVGEGEERGETAQAEK
jgi:hypothetical protein